METVAQKSAMNTVPDGYKRTEVGVIPEDWEINSLNELARIIDGDRGKHYPSSSELSESGYCLFLNAKNVTKDGFKFSKCEFISKIKNKELGKGKLKRGDIVLTTRGTLGNVAFYSSEIPYSNIRINSGMIIIRIDGSDNYSLYIFETLRSYLLELQIQRLSFGSAQPQLTKGIVNKLSFALPQTLEEQRAIAEALGDVDALIAELDALIQKKQQVKKGAMQQLLSGKKRLPGFSGEWEEKKLGDVCQIVNGGTPSTKKSKYWDGQIFWCTPTDITSTNGNYISETKKNITTKGLKNSSTSLLPKGSLLLCSRATIGEIKIAACEITTNQGFKSLVCSDSANNEFLYNLIILQKQKFIDRAFGSTFLEISKKNTQKVEFIFPKLKEQKAIAQILSDMDAEIQSLQEKRSKYEKVKQGMMQELLTGKTRLV